MIITKDQIDRFYNKVNKDTPTGCWEWTAGLDKDGYGTFKLDGKKWRAHRLSWIIAKGDIPEDIVVCHTCDNRKCCNDSHLFLGNNSMNTYDAIRKRRKADTSGEANGRAILTENKVIEIRYLCEQGLLSQKEISERTGISQALISMIKTKKIWKDV